MKTDRRDAELLGRLLLALLPSSPWQVQVGRLRCLRGIDTLTAVGLCGEIGDFERFARAEQLMSYLGLVPSESSSGQQRRLGSITKTGSSPRFLAVAARRLRHLFPRLPERTAFHKRPLRLGGPIEGLITEFARHDPGFYDELLLVDSTPVECARSLETVKRGGTSSLTDALANAADYGYCASHSRFFWGFRLHAPFALDGTPRALALTSPKVDEKQVCVQMVARYERQAGQMLILIGDKNFRGKDFEAELATGAEVFEGAGAVAFDSPPASPHSPPQSRSTTDSAAQAALPRLLPHLNGTTHLLASFLFLSALGCLESTQSILGAPSGFFGPCQCRLRASTQCLAEFCDSRVRERVRISLARVARLIEGCLLAVENVLTLGLTTLAGVELLLVCVVSVLRSGQARSCLPRAGAFDDGEVLTVGLGA